jgi:hypothetical protein
MRKETRAAVADRQNKIDAHASKVGQREATRYLESKEEKRWMPDLFDTVLFCVTMAALAVLILSL